MTIATPAAGQWQALRQSGGYGVARIEMAGPIRGVALTCERAIPILAVRPARHPARSPATLALTTGDGRVVEIAMARNGATDVWFAAIRNPAIIEAFAVGTVQATMGSAPSAVASDGADSAFRAVLAGCYRADPAHRPAASPAQGPLAPADMSGITQAVRSYYTEDEASFTAATTRSYGAIVERCSALQEKIVTASGEWDGFGMCGEDASPICECQDMDGAAIADTLRVEIRPVSAGVVTAVARFDLFRGDTVEARAPTEVFYRVVRGAGGWKIDDILDETTTAANSTNKAFLLGAIAEMETRLKLSPWTAPPPEQPFGVISAAIPAGATAQVPGGLSPADRTAAFRAAGFVQRGSDWRSDCDDPGTASYSPGTIEVTRDLNGDGQPDAIIVEGGTYCYGNTGAGYFIVSKRAGGEWVRMTGGQGIVTVLPTTGVANWPDLEIGGPGFCFPVYRWNGREYDIARHQYDGKPCTPRSLG